MTFVASIDSEGAQNFFGCFCLIWQSMETTKNVTAKIMNLIRVKTISSIYWNIYLIASKVLVLVYHIISGHWRSTDKKRVVKYFAKFTAQHLYKSLRSLRSATLLKKKLRHRKKLRYRCFPVNLGRLSRTPFNRTLPVAASVLFYYLKL